MTHPADLKSAKGLDFCRRMHQLCQDICIRLPELKHVDMDRVVVSIRRARKQVLHGLQASLTPLRFAGGKRWERRRGCWWGIQPVLTQDGQEALYLLNFYLPRFLDQPFEEKLTIVIHELWHISPRFDGDLRRFPGRCHLHTHRQKDYDAWSASLARAYLASNPPAERWHFLRYSFAELLEIYGQITGVQVQQPKLFPLDRLPSRSPYPNEKAAARLTPQ